MGHADLSAPGTARPQPTAAPAPPARRPARRREGARTRAAWLALALALLAVSAGLRFSALAPDALTNDLGIQFNLSRMTARGAVPLIDFEHGWNAGAWYVGALLYALAGGSATVWAFLREHLFGTFLTGAALLAAGWRLRLPGPWLVGTALAFLWLVKVPHGKYALPALWLLTLLPVGRTGRGWPALALRAGAAAVTFWSHVELALVLTAGVALFDLVGARHVPLRTRLARAGAGPVGLVAALLAQAGVFAALGLPPGELVRQLLADPSRVDVQFHFGYPLLAPPDLRTLLYPASLVLPFVPALWRRLRDPTRLVALLHLSQALIAIRRTDPSHVAAAGTLLALLAVLAAFDLRSARAPDHAVPRDPLARAAAAALGAAWFTAAVAVGFRVEALAAAGGLTLLCLAGVAAGRRGDATWASLGALAAAAGLVAVGLGGHVAGQARASQEQAVEQEVAAVLRRPLDRCVGDDRRVWVVPYPLGLYDALDITNPTPFVMFWYPFRSEHARVVALMDAGAIPAILQFGDWPTSWAGLEDHLAARYQPCATVTLPEDGRTVTVWVGTRNPTAR